ncbi:MAG: NAD+ kinase [Cellvibrionaceae bacterium]|jgi:NAD+ kinase
MSIFSTIGLLGRVYNDQTRCTAERLIDFLTRRGVDFIVLEAMATMLQRPDLRQADEEAIGQSCDLAIVIGGDGSMLGAGRAMVFHQVPVLGVNRGRLGFLTDIMPDEIEKKVAEVLDGQYIRESRFLLDTVIARNDQHNKVGSALNDVVLHPGRYIRMIEFELYIDGQFVYSQSSDGLIVSTPTGSTAYALSGGGPLMHPSLNAIVLVPLNPHTLSSRPIVVSGDSQIRLVIGEMTTTVNVTFDGQVSELVRPGEEILITKKPSKLELIHPTNHNYYETCRTKLGWSQHLITGKPRKR